MQRFAPERVVRSDLGRTAATAAPLVGLGVGEVVDPRWREVAVGAWEGESWELLRATQPELLAAWRRFEDVRAPGGETFAELRERIAAALDDLLAGQGVSVVVTHGAALRVAVTVVLGVPVAAAAGLGPARNCGLTEVALLEGRPRLVAYNEVGHLDGLVAPAAPVPAA